MAVIYTPRGPASTPYVFGGTVDGAKNLPGPFPRYDISTEVVRQDTLKHFRTKHSITISGTALIAASASMLVEGARQSQIHVIIKRLHRMATDSKHGRLEIQPYGGGADIITLEDARITSVSTPEQSEQSSGVQSQDYSVTFEGYFLSDMNNVDDFDGFHLSTAGETWDVAPDEGRYQDINPNFSGANTKRIFTVSHSISATGIDVLSAGDFDQRGWKQARDWCESRCVATPDWGSATIPPMDRQPNPSAGQDTTNIPLQIPLDYVVTNVVRSRSIDHLGNSYSINETFILVPPDGYLATSTIEVTGDNALDSDSMTVNVTISVTGLPSIEDPDGTGLLVATSGSRYANAQALASVLSGLAPAYALNFYGNHYMGDTPTGRTLVTDPEVSRSETHNETDGAVSIQLSYNDRCVSDTNALSENISLNWSNRDGLNKVIALIPVIGKATGPVLQDMGTTNETTLSISIEKKMSMGHRSSIPAHNASAYVPGGAFRRSMTENWNPLTGSFSYTAEYVMCAARAVGAKEDGPCP
jgi:hypothetical protein